MKVTIVCDVLGNKNNGTTIAAYNLINYLKSRGHEVTVICPDQTKKGEEGYRVVPVLNLGAFCNNILKNNGVELAKPDKAMLTEVIRESDVVHILIPLFLGSAAAKIAKSEGKPITASFHAQAENVSAHIFCMDAKLINHLTYFIFDRVLYRYVDTIHYPTEFIREVFERAVKKQYPCRVISNGVNDIFFEPVEKKRLSDKFTILCMGRFSNEKNQQVLINAVAKCKMKDDVKIYFAGSGPKEKKLRRLAERKGVDCDFNFYSRAELLTVLHGADLYVHTALIEIEAISCMEAIVSGLVPVICNSERSATRRFAVDERCLFEERDSDDLAKKIEYFYDHPEQIEAYKEKYVSFRNRCRQEDCMQKMEQMLTDTMELRKRA